jgi:hypothetical protein
MNENTKHAAESLKRMANDIRTQRFTRQMLGAMAAKMDGLAVLLEQEPAPELLAVLEPIADLYHAWISDDTGMGHPAVASYASSKPRADKFAGISLTREQVLEIVALVAKAKGQTP